MDQLAIAIKLLLGESEEKFAYERQLPMFQFQCWLLDTREQESSFRRSAVIFGAAALSREISGRSKRGLGKRDSYLLTIASKNMEQIINRCFAIPNDMYSLMRAGAFPLSKKSHDDAKAKIEKLNTVLEVRLRLHAADQPSSLAKTWEMLPKLAKGIGAKTALEPLHKGRRQRQPFLYAAERVAPEFLTMKFDGLSTFITPGGIVAADVREGEKSRLVRRLCGTAKAIAEVIEDDVKWSEEMVSALVNVQGELPEMKPIPASICPRKSRAAPRPKQGRPFATGSAKIATRVADFRCLQDLTERHGGVLFNMEDTVKDFDRDAGSQAVSIPRPS